MKPLFFGALAMLALVGVGLFVLTRLPTTAPEDSPGVERPTPDPTPSPVKPDASTSRSADTPPPRAPRAPTPAPPPPKPVTATLVVSSDVPGASVFVDRKFVGTTPLRLADLPPGSKQLKFTAEGFDGVDRTVELEPGENPVNVRFREVRLNERIAVEHKHGMGGCEGTLVATVDGLAYQTSNANDAFRLSFDQVETFEVNYLDKNLRVKQRGGKTWNFTDKNAANADALFVFHRDVQAAREKLAKGYAPVR
jgi:hypothetical protein